MKSKIVLTLCISMLILSTAACQNKKLFKIDLEEFEVTGLQKNAHNKMFDIITQTNTKP